MSPFRNVRISHFPSLPLRECGLKFRKIIYAVETGGVTPLAGVWIEISGIRANSASPSVTPLAGVWIEIYEFFVSFRIVPSLPLRECGLKSDVIVKVSFSSLSLPLRECGLKYAEITSAAFSAVSLPLRECGLKLRIQAQDHGRILSLPLRECGLKLNKIPVQTLQ